jgi:hypothetical protein
MVDTKNHYNYWRPVTAIQTGDTDGNPDTTGDPSLDTVARLLRTRTTPRVTRLKGVRPLKC